MLLYFPFKYTLAPLLDIIEISIGSSLVLSIVKFFEEFVVIVAPFWNSPLTVELTETVSGIVKLLTVPSSTVTVIVFVAFPSHLKCLFLLHPVQACFR